MDENTVYFSSNQLTQTVESQNEGENFYYKIEIKSRQIQKGEKPSLITPWNFFGVSNITLIRKEDGEQWKIIFPNPIYGGEIEVNQTEKSIKITEKNTGHFTADNNSAINNNSIKFVSASGGDSADYFKITGGNFPTDINKLTYINIMGKNDESKPYLAKNGGVICCYYDNYLIRKSIGEKTKVYGTKLDIQYQLATPEE